MLNRAARRIVHPKPNGSCRLGPASIWPGITRCQVEAARDTACKTYPPGSRKVEAIKVHHFVPGRHKVTHEGRLRVAAGIDFRDGPELGV